MQSKPIQKPASDMWAVKSPSEPSQGHGKVGWYKLATEQVREGDRVLDIGCSMARQHPRYYEKNPSLLVGVDVSKRALEAATILGPNHKLYHVDEFEDEEQFDVVTAMDVIEHVEEDIDFLENAYRRAKRFFMLATPNGKYSSIGRFHCREYSPVELYDLMRKVCTKGRIEIMGWSGDDMLADRRDGLRIEHTYEGVRKLGNIQLLASRVFIEEE